MMFFLLLYSVIWLFIVLGCIGCTIWLLGQMINKMVDPPIATKMSSTYEKKLTLPDITICNLNKYNKSVVYKEGNYMGELFVEGLLSRETREEAERILRLAGENIEEWEQRVANINHTARQFVNVTDEFLKVAHTKEASIIGAINLGTGETVKHKFTETITDQGSCFTYHNEKHIIYNGRINEGLSLFLDLHTEEHTADESDTNIEGFAVCGRIISYTVDDLNFAISLIIYFFELNAAKNDFGLIQS